ncbi:MAG: nitroreductase [Flavobacteriales bacterium]|nr:nitroreductase [Flavobacteriales bacterium]
MKLEPLIKNRRNVKPQFFSGEIIPDKLIKELLESANWAPSHRYTEPWRFVVFSGTSRALMGEFQSSLYKETTPVEAFDQVKYDKLVNTPCLASHVIAVVAKNTKTLKVPFLEEVAATSCAVQNILLSAAAKEIAVHWSSGFMPESDAMKTFLGYEPDDVILGFLYFGKSEQKVNKSGKRFSSIQSKTIWR